MKITHGQLIDAMYLRGDLIGVERGQIQRVVAAMVRIINDNAQSYEPTKIKGFGVFGWRAYKLNDVVNPRVDINATATKTGGVYKSGVLPVAGATSYTVVFRPERGLKKL